MNLPPGYSIEGAGGTCPPRIVVTAYGSANKSSTRITLDRAAGEAEVQFWLRALCAARDMAEARQSADRFGDVPGGRIHCEYSPTTSLEQAEAADDRFNFRQVLLLTSRRDPSHRLRVWALCRLAEMDFPEARV